MYKHVIWAASHTVFSSSLRGSNGRHDNKYMCKPCDVTSWISAAREIDPFLGQYGYSLIDEKWHDMRDKEKSKYRVLFNS